MKKQLRAVLAIILIAALFVTIFAACTTQDNTPNTSGDNNSNSSNDTTTGNNNTSGNNSADEDDEIISVNFYCLDEFMKADLSDHVFDTVNAYLEENYHLHVNFSLFDTGSWMTKIQLALGGGDQVDLMTLCVGNGLNALYNNTMLMDITDLAAEYAPETMELMADYLGAYQIGGRLYGFPTNRPLATNRYIVMRKDILQSLDLVEKAENLNSWSEYEQIMQAVKDAYGDTGMYPLTRGNGYSTLPEYLLDGDSFDDVFVYDTLGDNYHQILTDYEGNVSWLLDDPRFEEKLQLVASWAEKGYIWPDSAYSDDQGHDLMKADVSFSYLVASEYGVETAKGNQCGHEVICPMYADAIIATSGLQSWGIGIPVTAQEPEAACQLLDVLYTDSYVMNTLIRGIEGEDYTLDADGCVQYPSEGQYYRQMDWLYGNNLLLTPMSGNGADYYEQCTRFNDAATKSPYLGFVFDSSEWDLVVSQISAAYQSNYPDLYTGNYTAEKFQAYKDTLKVAGIEDYIAAYQTQLNAWSASN